jgi:hypothetical protein
VKPLKFSAEIGRRLQGVIDASYFLQAEDRREQNEFRWI